MNLEERITILEEDLAFMEVIIKSIEAEIEADETIKKCFTFSTMYGYRGIMAERHSR